MNLAKVNDFAHADPALVYGQVEETREGQRDVKVEKKLVLGSPDTELTYITTSLLERQNGTARSRNRYLVRKTYAFAKTVPYLDDQCGVDKTFHDFCRRHRGLKGRTPAMRQGIADHVCSSVMNPERNEATTEMPRDR